MTSRPESSVLLRREEAREGHPQTEAEGCMGSKLGPPEAPSGWKRPEEPALPASELGTVRC